METSRELPCLECGAQMDQRVEHGVTIDYCPKCGGVWLDPGELESLTGNKHHGHHSHSRDIDVELEFDEEEEEEGGLLDAVASALGGGEEEYEEGGYEEEEYEEGGYEEE